MNIPKKKIEWCDKARNNSDAFDLIEENLRLLYDAVAEEELPDRFEKLIAQLEKREAPR